MPPSRKTKRSQPDHRWIAGGMRGVKHEKLIARGGYGEVHKVNLSFALLTMQMFNEGTGEVSTEYMCSDD